MNLKPSKQNPRTDGFIGGLQIFRKERELALLNPSVKYIYIYFKFQTHFNEASITMISKLTDEVPQSIHTSKHYVVYHKYIRFLLVIKKT